MIYSKITDMKFIWSENYSVGVKLIDKQHRHFFEIANELYDLIEQKVAQRKTLFSFINELGNYALYHFNTEEEYFRKFNYIDAAPHIKEHNDFRERIQKYISSARDIDTNIEGLVYEVAGFSINWLSNHILIMDKKYAPLFNEHGLV